MRGSHHRDQSCSSPRLVLQGYLPPLPPSTPPPTSGPVQPQLCLPACSSPGGALAGWGRGRLPSVFLAARHSECPLQLFPLILLDVPPRVCEPLRPLCTEWSPGRMLSCWFFLLRLSLGSALLGFQRDPAPPPDTHPVRAEPGLLLCTQLRQSLLFPAVSRCFQYSPGLWDPAHSACSLP